MERVPDIVGLTLEDALRELKEAGWAVDLKYTRPLKGDPGGEPRAVLFNVVSEHKGVLTVVYEAIGEKVKIVAYKITDECVACGTCMESRPTGAIIEE